MLNWKKRTRKGFTLIELLVVIAIIALLIAILLPGLAEARRIGRTAQCMGNLQQYGVATQSYSTDFQDLIWAFTWKGTGSGSVPPIPYVGNEGYALGLITGDGRTVATRDFDAQADQASWIIRYRGDRPPNEMQRRLSWVSSSLYSHLVINDYLAQRLPEPMVVCPEDRARKMWQTDPRAYPGAFQPLVPNNPRPQWPYSSSYVVTISAWDSSPPQDRIRQGPSHGSYFTTQRTTVGNNKLGDVAFPSQKVHKYDYNQRHFGTRQPSWVLAMSRQPLLMFDGSVTVRRSGDANPGAGNNQNHTVPTISVVNYRPQGHEPPPITGPTQDTGHGYYRWTRGGLRGIDFPLGVPERVGNRYRTEIYSYP